MKPFHYVVIGILAGAAGGFILAWQLKPADGNSESAAVTPLRTRVERSMTTPHPLGKPAPSAFSRQWEEADQTDDTEEKRKALLAALGSDEFPALLAEVREKAGMLEPDYDEVEQIQELVHAWHRKTPEAALAWLRALPNAKDRVSLLENIVEETAENDLDGALALLSQDGRDENGRLAMPPKVLEKAAAQGAEKLLEVCKLGIFRREKVVFPSNCGLDMDGCSFPNHLSYPEGFDYRRVLDGLAAVEAGFGEGETFAALPGNLLSEWAKRDLQAAWAWYREGKAVSGNDGSDVIEAAPPAEAGALLASVFDASANNGDGCQDARIALLHKPSPELLDAFLQAVPGDRAAHLAGLLDLGSSGSSNSDEFRALILERMSSEQRVEILRSEYEDRDPRTRAALTRTLRALGHSDEEIRTLLPERKD